MITFFFLLVATLTSGIDLKPLLGDLNPIHDYAPSDRPPRPRPEDQYLNKNCFASPSLPPYLPFVPVGSLSGMLTVPQSDTTPYLVARWIAEFKKYFPSLDIYAPINGSGIAGPCLAAGSCNFSIIAREMLLAELDLFRAAHGYEPYEIAVGGGSYNALAFTDGMTFMVHPTNPLASISYSEIDAIWSQDRFRGYPQRITKWGQLPALSLNPDWKDKQINLVGVQSPNGFEYFLNRTITLGGRWVPGILNFTTVFQIATAVSKDPQSMGYTGFAYLNATVKQLDLRADVGWPYLLSEFRGISPTKDNVCKRSYPLSRLIYIYLNKKPCVPLRAEEAEFLNFVLSYEGQKQVELDQIFYPLQPETLLELREKLFAARVVC